MWGDGDGEEDVERAEGVVVLQINHLRAVRKRGGRGRERRE